MVDQEKIHLNPVLAAVIFMLVLCAGGFAISLASPKRNGVATSDKATPQPVTVSVVVQTAPAGRKTSITLTCPAACEVKGAASEPAESSLPPYQK